MEEEASADETMGKGRHVAGWLRSAQARARSSSVSRCTGYYHHTPEPQGTDQGRVRREAKGKVSRIIRGTTTVTTPPRA